MIRPSRINELEGGKQQLFFDVAKEDKHYSIERTYDIGRDGFSYTIGRCKLYVDAFVGAEEKMSFNQFYRKVYRRAKRVLRQELKHRKMI